MPNENRPVETNGEVVGDEQSDTVSSVSGDAGGPNQSAETERSVNLARNGGVSQNRKLIARSLAEFLDQRYPPVEYVVEPWFPMRGLTMIAGYRGIGKTFFALSVSHAISTGGTFLEFRVPQPRKVVYVDGEMDPAELQERLQGIQRAAERDRNGHPSLASKNLIILSHADQEFGIPDLADPEGNGRRMIEARLGDADVLILDNLSSLCRTGIENDADSWTVMQDWLVELRRKGKGVLMLHHTGKPDKNGNVRQRGTSKREDVLNTSILLRDASKRGFTMEFTKTRGFQAPDPCQVRVEIMDGCCTLRHDTGLTVAIRALMDKGLNQKQIAEQLHISEASVSRHKPKEEMSEEESEQEVCKASGVIEPRQDFTETGSESL